jgi:hypothetical protein
MVRLNATPAFTVVLRRPDDTAQHVVHRLYIWDQAKSSGSLSPSLQERSVEKGICMTHINPKSYRSFGDGEVGLPMLASFTEGFESQCTAYFAYFVRIKLWNLTADVTLIII